MRDTMKLLSQINAEDPDVTINDMFEFVSIFTGVPFEDLKDADISDIKKVYYGGLTSFHTYEEKDPPNEIKTNGQVYVRQQFEKGKGKGGWYIDVKVRNSEFLERPELLAAMNYIEKGMDYAQKNKKGEIINPTEARAQIFKDHFKPDDYLNLHRFFLKTSEHLKDVFLELRTHQVLKMMIKTSRINKRILGNWFTIGRWLYT